MVIHITAAVSYNVGNKHCLTTDPVMGTPQEAASVKGGKTKDKKAAKDPASTAPTGKKSKIDATVKVDALEKAFPPVYITKDWSALALRGQNSNLKVYIRLMGFVGAFE